MDADRTNDLGGYLRARRALVTPESVGILSASRRRVGGLRREEVAMLAGISADYYLRLERGKDRNPSTQVVEALARVLRLDDVEAEYLLSLRGPVRRERRPAQGERVPERLHELLAALQVPAFVEGRYFDVLAANSLAVALSPRLAPGHNRLRSLLLDPEERDFHQDWDSAVAEFIAIFRQSVGAEPPSPRAHEIVGELSLASARFRTLWARQDVRRVEGGRAHLNHPDLGTLDLNREKLPVEGLLVVIYYPDRDSESARRLALLGSQPAH